MDAMRMRFLGMSFGEGGLSEGGGPTAVCCSKFGGTAESIRE